MSKSEKREPAEIYKDVYFKKLLAAFETKANNEVPFDQIITELEDLANKMAWRIPQHLDRINECITLFATMLNNATESVLKKKRRNRNNKFK